MPDRPAAARALPAPCLAGCGQRPAVAAAADRAAAATPHAIAHHAGARSPAPRSAPPTPAATPQLPRAADPTTTIPTCQFLPARLPGLAALNRPGESGDSVW